MSPLTLHGRPLIHATRAGQSGFSVHIRDDGEPRVLTGLLTTKDLALIILEASKQLSERLK